MALELERPVGELELPLTSREPGHRVSTSGLKLRLGPSLSLSSKVQLSASVIHLPLNQKHSLPGQASQGKMSSLAIGNLNSARMSGDIKGLF